MRSLPMAVLVAACALAPACSGGPVSFEDYCHKLTQMSCEAAVACDCIGEITVDVCVSWLLPECKNTVETPVRAGRVQYDPAAGGACIHQISSILSDCSLQGDDYPDACDAVLVGVKGEGEPCDDDEVCQPGLDCRDDRCVSMPGDGDPCLDHDCDEDLICGPDDKCHERAGQGASCEDDDQCQDDLYCNEVAKQCRSYPGSGEPCVAGRCQDGTYCGDGDVCRDVRSPGEACSADHECATDRCEASVCAEEDSEVCDFVSL